MIKYELRRMATNLPLIIGLLLITAFNVLDLRGVIPESAPADEAFAYFASRVDYSIPYAAAAMAVALGREFGSRGVSTLVMCGHGRGSIYTLKLGAVAIAVILAALLTPTVLLISGMLKLPSWAVLWRFIAMQSSLAAALSALTVLGCVLVRDALRSVVIPAVALVTWERLVLSVSGGMAQFVMESFRVGVVLCDLSVGCAIALVGYLVFRRAALK